MLYTGSVTDRRTKKPLAGVPVSDGRNVTVTDDAGCFALAGWERAHTVHVGVLTAGRDDWFFVIDGHEGRFDFIIEPVDAASDFCFFHTSDTEIEGRERVEWTSFMRQNVERYSPVFFVHTGDLCRERGVERHYLVMNRETLGCPVRYVIGNHDFIGERYGEEVYESLYGPSWYSFDCGEVHFVALSIGKGDKPSGYLPEDQWIWLKKDLAANRKGKRLIVLDHNLCREDETGFCPTVGNVTVDLRAEDLLAWIFGHYHNHYAHEYDGVWNICTALPDSGGIDSSPGGIRLLTVKHGALSSKMIYHCPERGASDPSVWRTELWENIEFCTPLVEKNGVFVATSDDGFLKNCGIYRLDTENGRIVWEYPTCDGIKGDIAYDSGRIYAQDTAGRLYCLDAESGGLVWQAKSKLSLPAYTRNGVLIVKNLVIAGAAQHLCAYEKESGAIVWEAERMRCEATPAKTVYDPERDQLIVSAHWKCLAALDRKTGAIKWQNTMYPLWFRTATPLVTERVIYAVGAKSVMKVDPLTGEILREVSLGCDTAVGGAPVLDGDELYLPTVERGVLALDCETLAVKRGFGTAPSALFTPPYAHGNLQTVEGTPAVEGDRLIFSGSDGCLRVFDKNTAELLRCVSIGAPSLTPPVLRGGCVYVADFLGGVSKFGLA